MKIEVGKTYDLKNRGKVHIVHKMDREENPFVGVIKCPGMIEHMELFNENGESAWNQVMEPEQFIWINVGEVEETGELYVDHISKNPKVVDYYSNMRRRVGRIKVKLERRFDE